MVASCRHFLGLSHNLPSPHGGGRLHDKHLGRKIAWWAQKMLCRRLQKSLQMLDIVDKSLQVNWWFIPNERWNMILRLSKWLHNSKVWLHSGYKVDYWRIVHLFSNQCLVQTQKLPTVCQQGIGFVDQRFFGAAWIRSMWDSRLQCWYMYFRNCLCINWNKDNDKNSPSICQNFLGITGV